MPKLPPIAILAGGLATRLRPITHKVPKSLVLVAGKPFIDHQLRLLKSYGAKRVVLCVGHLGNLVEKHVGNGNKFGLDVSYSYDGDKRLGTGGALKKALPILGNYFFVMYGDSYLETPLAPIAQKFKSVKLPALMVVYKNKGKYDNSNVVFSKNQIVLYDKKQTTPDMHYIDYGIGVLKARVLSEFDGDCFDLADLYMELVKKSELAGFEVSERFYEVGSHSGLKEANEYLTKKKT